ncbi:MAG TPA: DNA gyrase inhibitor YacG [Steroidobacteraceae bacterium]
MTEPRRAPRVPCPTCRREIEWSEASPYRPFCSERCRLIDLGGWLSERHAIPGESVDIDAEDEGTPRGGE